MERLLLLLQQKESQHLEFKEAKFALPGGLFETICAMLNGDGGDILVGVNDLGNITGVEASQVDKMIKDLVNLSNDPTKISPTFILFPRKYQVRDKWLIHVHIPKSSQVHKTSKFIYNRSSDGDFKSPKPTKLRKSLIERGCITRKIPFIQPSDLRILTQRFSRKSGISSVATTPTTRGSH